MATARIIKSMKYTKINQIYSDGIVVCEDGYHFDADMDAEGTFIETNSVRLYIKIGMFVAHK